MKTHSTSNNDQRPTGRTISTPVALTLLLTAALPAWAGGGNVGNPGILPPQSQGIPIVDKVGTPQFTAIPGATPLAGARTIPHWSFNATDPSNGQTYQLTMVGADPAAGTSTTVASEIIPLRLNFANGATLDGTARVSAVVASPVFSEHAYSAQMAGGDVGQYSDVFMRAQFNSVGSGYHMKLGAPTILPTVTIDVPQNQGLAVQTRAGVLVGLVDVTWFSSRLHNLLGQLHMDPTTIPVFLTDNSMLYEGNEPNNCCIIGYHGAPSPTGVGAGSVNSQGNAAVQTFIYAAYTTPGTFGGGGAGIQDIHALSHEVAEWCDDPFVNNLVQPWLTPTAPQYGCTPFLEVGDPVVGIWFGLPGNPDVHSDPLGVWHPEDEVFWPWFLRQFPSSSYGGHYTFMGSGNPYPGFQVPATGCQ
jgi:hypothetical protein